MTYFILNLTVQPESHSVTTETSKFFVFGNICACLDVFVIIGKFNDHSMVDPIICPLGNFALIIFVGSCTLFMWEDTATKFTMHTESATAEFPLLLLVCFLWLVIN